MIFYDSYNDVEVLKLLCKLNNSVRINLWKSKNRNMTYAVITGGCLQNRKVQDIDFYIYVPMSNPSELLTIPCLIDSGFTNIKSLRDDRYQDSLNVFSTNHKVFGDIPIHIIEKIDGLAESVNTASLSIQQIALLPFRTPHYYKSMLYLRGAARNKIYVNKFVDEKTLKKYKKYYPNTPFKYI